jgi:4'-phosphopantetheinyl transferase
VNLPGGGMAERTLSAMDPVSESARWIRPTGRRLLAEGEVHVWRITLDQPGSVTRRLHRLLSDDERVRASEYAFARDGERFTVLRSALRTILCGYTGIESTDIPLAYGPRGKPLIGPRKGLAPIHFNVSHSAGLGLVAVARGHRVGVDLEAVRASFEWMPIAERFFSARERESISSLPASDQADAFSVLWTRKEACLKAAGLGLAGGLEQVEVSTDPHESPMLLRAPIEMLPLSRWELIDLEPGEGFRGCLVVEGSRVRQRQWTWSYPPLLTG